jgi:hypothetical protein
MISSSFPPRSLTVNRYDPVSGTSLTSVTRVRTVMVGVWVAALETPTPVDGLASERKMLVRAWVHGDRIPVDGPRERAVLVGSA